MDQVAIRETQKIEQQVFDAKVELGDVEADSHKKHDVHEQGADHTAKVSVAENEDAAEKETTSTVPLTIRK